MVFLKNFYYLEPSEDIYRILSYSSIYTGYRPRPPIILISSSLTAGRALRKRRGWEKASLLWPLVVHLSQAAMPSMDSKVGGTVVALVRVERAHVANGVFGPELALLVQLEAAHRGRAICGRFYLPNCKDIYDRI